MKKILLGRLNLAGAVSLSGRLSKAMLGALLDTLKHSGAVERSSVRGLMKNRPDCFGSSGQSIGFATWRGRL